VGNILHLYAQYLAAMKTYKIKRTRGHWEIERVKHGTEIWSDHTRIYNMWNGTERALYSSGSIYQYRDRMGHGHTKATSSIHTLLKGVHVGISYH
jgi:hypothetical protein